MEISNHEIIFQSKAGTRLYSLISTTARDAGCDSMLCGNREVKSGSRGPFSG